VTVADLATTVGLLVGALAIGVSGSTNAGRKYLYGLIAFGLLFVQFFYVHDLWLVAVVLFGAGVANQYFGVPMLTLLQTYTDSETRGRVFAVRSTIARIAAVIGLAGAGVFAQAYGAVPTAVGLGVVVLAIGLLGFSMPSLRRA